MHGALYGPAVAEGDWYRLITAAFLHYGPIHLAMNMLALWWIGRPLEAWLGPVRYLLLYLVSGLAGSAGALIANPEAVTVGASGAIFGILGAAIVLERQQTYVLGGSAITLLVVNLAFTFAVPGSRSAATSAASPAARCASSRSPSSASGARSTAGSTSSRSRASWPSACSASRSRTGRCAATPKAATAALETSGLSKTYRGGVAALADLDLRVEQEKSSATSDRTVPARARRSGCCST